MATYDVTGPGGTNRPGRYNPGIRTPYLVENTIDVSAINGDSGAAQTNGWRRPGHARVGERGAAECPCGKVNRGCHGQK